MAERATKEGKENSFIWPAQKKLTCYAAHPKKEHNATDEKDTIYLTSSLNFPGFSTTSLI